MNARISKELLAVISLWLIAALCLAGKINSFQKYWTQRHHTSLPLEAQWLTADANAQEAVDGYLQKGTLAFLSRQDPNQFASVAELPAAPPAIQPAAATQQPLALHTATSIDTRATLLMTGSNPARPVAGLSPVMVVKSAAAAPGNTAVATAAGSAAAKTEASADSVATEWQPNYAAAEKLALSRGDKILFAGDSLMQGLVPHLTRGLRRDGIRHYLDASKQSTGFSYPATFDWPSKIKTAIVRDGVNTVIIFIGANDAWSLASGGKLYSFGSPPWKQEYTRRVREVVQFAHQHKVRVVWLELPPMHYDNLTKGRQLLNTIYRQVVQEESALFISTTHVVSDDDDKFGLFKTLEGGKVAQTRLDDGVHFTKLGQTLISQAVLQHISVHEVSGNE